MINSVDKSQLAFDLAVKYGMYTEYWCWHVVADKCFELAWEDSAGDTTILDQQYARYAEVALLMKEQAELQV